MIRKTFLFLLIFVLLMDINAYGLEKTTHEDLNDKAAKKSDVNNYLVNQLKFSLGLETYFNKKWAIDWIKKGGIAEDEPAYSRSFNHFLNPIDNTGYLGLFKSAREWALEQGTFGSLFGGDYSIF